MSTVYLRHDARLGSFALRPVDPVTDAPLLHSWLTHPKSAFWLMQQACLDDVVREYHAIVADPDRSAYLGLHRGEPTFLVERYDPRHDLGHLYPAHAGDVGMHLLVAPTTAPIHGFTRAVITTVMEMLFADPATARVVVEPDVRNAAVHALNAYVGFRPHATVPLPTKDALLSLCDRRDFEASRAAALTRDAVTHLTPAAWERANRLLVAKALAEFAHEKLITPAEAGAGRYEVVSDDATGRYRFTATRAALDHWRVDATGISRHQDGESRPVDALDFVVDLRGALGLSAQVLPVYLEEITSTLAGIGYRLSRPATSAADLARADFQTIETGMTEGHPCFVANNGRLGFAIADYHAYAPEAGQHTRLLWLAARRDRSTFVAGAGLDYHTLIESELDPATRRRFTGVLTTAGLRPDDYYLFPVHPWQWQHRIAVTFAGEVARQHLVLLGCSDDEYLPQQSVRTFFNASVPRRHYVKTALSVLNMGFLRGLSAEYLRATPAINDWLADLVAGDDVLTRTGLTVLRERAAIGYHHPQYEAATGVGSPYRKMLAALWRESPVPLLGPGERLATMASLLHLDRDGDSLVGALIAGSGQEPARWLRRYLDAYLTPLLHCFYAYYLVFMPHGENVILVLDERGVPQRAIFKDIAEEIAVMSPDVPLPPQVDRIRVETPDELKALSIFTDVFDGFFRFLAAILATEGVLSAPDFWCEVARCVRAYQASMPQLADRFARHDLFAEEFARSCLNRLQLRNNQQMVDLADPAGGLQFAGTLSNPIAGWRGVR